MSPTRSSSHNNGYVTWKGLVSTILGVVALLGGVGAWALIEHSGGTHQGSMSLREYESSLKERRIYWTDRFDRIEKRQDEFSHRQEDFNHKLDLLLPRIVDSKQTNKR